MDNNDIKAILDLETYIKDMGEDRPPVGVFLKHLNINPQTMQNCVMTSAQAIHYTVPEMAFQIANTLFKLGVTVGYKYATKREMEREFGNIEDAVVDGPCNHPIIEDGQGPNGTASGGEDEIFPEEMDND